MNRSMNDTCISDYGTYSLALVYSVEFCVALVGNVFALWLLVTKEKNNWHPGVVFSCNLAISDILYILNLPLLAIYYSKDQWDFGDAVCKMERFLFFCNLYVSIYFIMCISVNRYLSIAHPVFTRNHVRPKHAKLASLLVWISVSLMSSPVLYFAGVKNQKCFIIMDVEFMSGFTTYIRFMAVIGCFLPFLITFASYCAVIRVVFRNAHIPSLKKKKVTLLIAVVCVMYFISFLPLHIAQIWPKEHKQRYFGICNLHHVFQVLRVICCLNMCLHPILYMAVFKSIRTVSCRRNNK